ncbi:MAG: hypothetical protein M3O50_00635 [Myxococcota bacterium]|nr:hypothetical protein [Myxococcota bacterium]
MVTLCGPMLRRLFVGLMLGLAVGGIVAVGMVAGLHATTFVDVGGPLLAFAAAALTGVLTGLLAGKPIWASGARIEAGLKAFFGALISVGLMFALRRWAAGWVIDLSLISAGGPAPPGELPAASLPLIAALLGVFFELDDSGADTRDASDEKRSRRDTLRTRVLEPGVNGRANARALHNESASADEDPADSVSKTAKR